MAVGDIDVKTGDIKAGATGGQFGDLLTTSGAKVTAPVFNFGSRASDILGGSGGSTPWGLIAAAFAVVVFFAFRRKG